MGWVTFSFLFVYFWVSAGFPDFPFICFLFLLF